MTGWFIQLTNLRRSWSSREAFFDQRSFVVSKADGGADINRRKIRPAQVKFIAFFRTLLRCARDYI
jgi:hypothetical protein